MSEAQKCFDIEKNAKNRAYDFIIQNGLMDRFAQFCKQPEVNHHRNSVALLSLVATENFS